MAGTFDITFRTDRSGNMVKGTRGEYVCNTTQMLFAMIPGSDPYEPERGLAIQQHLNQAYVDGTRDANYESEIRKQFINYTDLSPTEVLAFYTNKTLFIYIAFLLDGDIYEVDVKATHDALDTILRS